LVAHTSPKLIDPREAKEPRDASELRELTEGTAGRDGSEIALDNIWKDREWLAHNEGVAGSI
jgi:hypothetical protein